MDSTEQARNTAEVDALREEVRQLRAALDKLTATGEQPDADTRDGARDFARELQQELRETLDTARERGRVLLDEARDKGDKAIDELEDRIEKYPLLALFLVFLAGLFLGKLFERR